MKTSTDVLLALRKAHLVREDANQEQLVEWILDVVEEARKEGIEKGVKDMYDNVYSEAYNQACDDIRNEIDDELGRDNDKTLIQVKDLAEENTKGIDGYELIVRWCDDQLKANETMRLPML